VPTCPQLRIIRIDGALFFGAVNKVEEFFANVFTVTMLSTLFLDLEFAIYMGIIISLIFYLQKTSSPHIVTLAPDNKNVCPLALNYGLYELMGPYFLEL